jgi:hypothetical protein
MDGSEIYEAMRNAIADADPKPQPLVIPLKPFRAERELDVDDVAAVNVVGIRFDPESGDWRFVCIMHDDVRDIHVVEDGALLSKTLPEI